MKNPTCNSSKETEPFDELKEDCAQDLLWYKNYTKLAAAIVDPDDKRFGKCGPGANFAKCPTDSKYWLVGQNKLLNGPCCSYFGECGISRGFEYKLMI